METMHRFTIEKKLVNHRWQGRGGFLPVAIVEHMMQGTIEETWRHFDGPVPDGEFPVSAHYGVARDGRIWQFVEDEDTAWANGVLQQPDLSIGWLKEVFEEQVNCNLVTLAIEFEGFSGQPLTEEQYQAGLALHRALVKRWEIEPDDQHIIGHHHIDSLERTDNPGPAFPWQRLFHDLATETAEAELELAPAPTVNPVTAPAPAEPAPIPEFEATPAGTVPAPEFEAAPAEVASFAEFEATSVPQFDPEALAEAAHSVDAEPAHFPLDLGEPEVAQPAQFAEVAPPDFEAFHHLPTESVSHDTAQIDAALNQPASDELNLEAFTLDDDGPTGYKEFAPDLSVSLPGQSEPPTSSFKLPETNDEPVEQSSTLDDLDFLGLGSHDLTNIPGEETQAAPPVAGEIAAFEPFGLEQHDNEPAAYKEFGADLSAFLPGQTELPSSPFNSPKENVEPSEYNLPFDDPNFYELALHNNSLSNAPEQAAEATPPVAGEIAPFEPFGLEQPAPVTPMAETSGTNWTDHNWDEVLPPIGEEPSFPALHNESEEAIAPVQFAEPVEDRPSETLDLDTLLSELAPVESEAAEQGEVVAEPDLAGAEPAGLPLADEIFAFPGSEPVQVVAEGGSASEPLPVFEMPESEPASPAAFDLGALQNEVNETGNLPDWLSADENSASLDPHFNEEIAAPPLPDFLREEAPVEITATPVEEAAPAFELPDFLLEDLPEPTQPAPSIPEDLPTSVLVLESQPEVPVSSQDVPEASPQLNPVPETSFGEIPPFDLFEEEAPPPAPFAMAGEPQAGPLETTAPIGAAPIIPQSFAPPSEPGNAPLFDLFEEDLPVELVTPMEPPAEVAETPVLPSSPVAERFLPEAFDEDLPIQLVEPESHTPAPVEAAPAHPEPVNPVSPAPEPVSAYPFELPSEPAGSGFNYPFELPSELVSAAPASDFGATVNPVLGEQDQTISYYPFELPGEEVKPVSAVEPAPAVPQEQSDTDYLLDFFKQNSSPAPATPDWLNNYEEVTPLSEESPAPQAIEARPSPLEVRPAPEPVTPPPAPTPVEAAPAVDEWHSDLFDQDLPPLEELGQAPAATAPTSTDPFNLFEEIKAESPIPEPDLDFSWLSPTPAESAAPAPTVPEPAQAAPEPPEVALSAETSAAEVMPAPAPEPAKSAIFEPLVDFDENDLASFMPASAPTPPPAPPAWNTPAPAGFSAINPTPAPAPQVPAPPVFPGTAPTPAPAPSVNVPPTAPQMPAPPAFQPSAPVPPAFPNVPAPSSLPDWMSGPPPAPAPSPVVPGMTPANLGPAVVSVDRANVRVRPSMDNGTVLKIVNFGQRFTLDGLTEGPELRGSTRWYHISQNEGGGWIHSTLVKLDKPPQGI